MLKFGDIVKFSQEWFDANKGSTEKWVERNKNTRMVVVGTIDDLVSVGKEGTRYVQTYHKSFLEALIRGRSRMKKAQYTDYQEFYETRSDLEDAGYTVKSISDFENNIFTLVIERSSLVNETIVDPDEFKEV